MNYDFFSEDELKTMAAPLKIGILATVNPSGQPHLSLISSIQACAPRQMVWGQFTEGLCKQFIREYPKTGFLIMSLEKEMWRGKATFTHSATSGREYDLYNQIPMFRYNAYFGIHTVYYMDLVHHSGRQALQMNAVVRAAVETRAARAFCSKHSAQPAMNTWTQGLFNQIDNLKFLAYVGGDGYPVVIPTIQAQPVGAGRMLFSTSAYRQDLEKVPPGASVAIFGMSLKMQDVLVRGTYRGARRLGLFSCGMLDVDWVYNSMPPTPKQIYPQMPLTPVIHEG
ncbi:MAG TPA: hypothetical protein VLH85_01340 [Levilinea sp.]|nr:hypothetical protein [Levilinea sp.]